MSNRELIACGLAIMGGFGGLAGTLAWSDIVAALNSRRSLDDQVRFGFTSREDFAWLSNNYPHPYWRLLKEFRQQNPGSRLYRWFVISLAWMFFFVIAAGATILLH